MYEDPNKQIYDNLMLVKDLLLKQYPDLIKTACLIGPTGSYSYGLQSNNSDIDIFVCTVNGKSETEIITLDSVNYKIDVFIYDLYKMFDLLCLGFVEPLLFINLQEWQYIHKTEIGLWFLKNKHRFLSKDCVMHFRQNINYYMYSLEILDQKENVDISTYKRYICNIINFSDLNASDKDALIGYINDLPMYYDISKNNGLSKDVFIDFTKLQIKNMLFKDFVKFINHLDKYLCIPMDAVSYSNNITQYSLDVGYNIDRIPRMLKTMSHVCRLYMTLFDILSKTQCNTYRSDKELSFLQSIRNGRYIDNDNTISLDFFKLINKYEIDISHLIETTTLKNSVDTECLYKEFMNAMQHTL